GSGLYLRLGIGVTEVLRELSGRKATTELERRAESLLPYCSGLQEHGFSMGPVETRAEATLGRSYDVAGTAYKFYEVEKIPDDALLLEDLGHLLTAYSKYVESRPIPSPPAAEITLPQGEGVAPLCLLGTARDWKTSVPDSERLIRARGAVANW